LTPQFPSIATGKSVKKLKKQANDTPQNGEEIDKIEILHTAIGVSKWWNTIIDTPGK